MITAYDFPTAKIIEEVGVDYILVGDSLGMVVLGYPDTKSVTMDDMIRHIGAVARGAKKTYIVGDMPKGSYKTKIKALKNAKKLLAAGAKAVKLEGNNTEVVSYLVKNKIHVMGHLGLLPQTAETYKVQGKGSDGERIFQDAKALQKAKVFAIVLECVPMELAKKITQKLSIPTIGIGAGPYCSGQVLVLHDVIGLSGFEGKFVKKYADAKRVISDAVWGFVRDVRSGEFPTLKNSFL